jgi:ketosteroid isomerase-like protein
MVPSRHSLVAVLALLLALPHAATGGALSTDEIARIEQTMAAYRQAWLDDDRPTILGTLSDAIVLFQPGSAGKVVGKTAVTEFWFPQSDESYPVREYVISDQEIFGGGDLAILSGRSVLTWETVRDGEVLDRTTSSSDFITVLRWEDGRWRIYRQMYQPRG